MDDVNGQNYSLILVTFLISTKVLSLLSSARYNKDFLSSVLCRPDAFNICVITFKRFSTSFGEDCAYYLESFIKSRELLNY